MAASSTPSRKKSLTWLVPASLGAGALALSLVTGSLGAFTASIANDNNVVNAGKLTMQETWTPTGGQTVTCNSTDDASNAATCSTINKYGSGKPMAPGDESSVTIKLTNTGTVDAKAAILKVGACATTTPTPAPTTPAFVQGTGNLCDQLQVTVLETPEGGTAKKVIDNKLAKDIATTEVVLSSPAATKSVTYEIKATLPAGLTNTYAGTSLKQALTWTYTA